MGLRVPFYFFNLITAIETIEIMRSTITIVMTCKFSFRFCLVIANREKTLTFGKMAESISDFAWISALLCYYRHQKLHQYQMVGNGTRVCNTAVPVKTGFV